MHGKLAIGAYTGFATACWVLLCWLVFGVGIGERPLFERWSLLAHVLLIASPALTFVPLARRWRAPLYDIEAIAGWGTFGYVFAFASPRPAPSLAEFLIFLLPLTVSLATICTLVAYVVGLRVCRDDAWRHDFVRARRQGYLAAIFLVALMLLHGIRVLTPGSGVLLFVVCILAEILVGSRRRPPAAATA